MKYFLVLIVIAVSVVFVSGTLGYILAQEYSPSGRDYVPYTENSNVSFNHDGNIDYDLLISKIMPEIFEKMLRDQGVNIDHQDIVLNRGPQISMYQESSYNCGYVIDYSDNQVYWLEAAITSQEIQYTRIFTETPTPDVPEEIEEFNLGWCFGPLKEEVATVFLKEKSYLTGEEEAVVAAAIKHEFRGNPNLNDQEFVIGKFNFDYGKDVLSFCGKFEKPNIGLQYFAGSLKNGLLGNFSLERSLSPLCAISDDVKIHAIKTNSKSDVPPELQAWKNIRMEIVYLKPNSVENLLERNYMHVENVHNMIFQYATSFEVEFVEFRLDASGTLFYFSPTEQDTYAKIRVPQNGANYFMSYGSNEWNAGDITKVIVSVEEEDPPFRKQQFVVPQCTISTIPYRLYL